MFDFASLSTAEASTDKVPPVLDRYELRGSAGKGGGGSVYKAYDTRLDRFVAIKVPIGMAAGSITEEAISQAAIEHPNIPRLLDFGDTLDNRVFISMELVDGLDIKEYCESKCVPLRRRIALLVQICNAVHHVHTYDPNKSAGHRDIRVANVLVTEKEGIVKVLDFGLSARLDQFREDDDDCMNSSTYVEAGVSWYRHGVEVDLYSIGIVAWQLLVGEPESSNAHRLDRKDPREVMATHRKLLGLIDDGGISESFAQTMSETPHTLSRKLQGDLRYILSNLIGCGATQYETVAEVEADLQAYLDYYPLKSKPASWREICVRFMQRNPMLTAATCSLSLIVMVVGGSLFFARQDLFKSQQRQGALNGQLADVYVEANPERPSESITRVPKSLFNILLLSAESLDPADTPLSDEEIRKTAQLADSLSASGLHAEAEKTWSVFYEYQIKQHGEEAAIVLPTRALFAAAKLKNGKGQEALDLAQRNIKCIRQFGGLSRSNAVALYNSHLIAATQAFGGRHDVALKVEEEVLRRHGQRKNELWADVSHGIATICIETRDYDRALEILDEVLEFYRFARGEDNPRSLLVAANRATALAGAGRGEQAIAEMRKVIHSFQEIFPDGGPVLEHHRLILATMLAREKHFTEAKAILQRVADQREYVQPRMQALVELAGIDILTGQYVGEARQQLLGLLPVIRKELRPDSPIVSSAEHYVKLADARLLDVAAGNE
ncbi:MAG: hypothetical protein Aurels2KO_57200 [Aureliella sp.]